MNSKEQSQETPAATLPAEHPRNWAKIRKWGVKLLVFGCIAFWLYRSTDASSLWHAITQLSLPIFALCLLIGLTNMSVATWRWRCLLNAFQDGQLPPYRELWRLFMIGLFYNTFIPGSVGGDVIRGIISRKYFQNPATSYIVVVLERLIGLSALGVLFLVGIAIGPKLIETKTLWLTMIGLIVFGVLLLAVAHWKGALQKAFSKLPPIPNLTALFKAFGLSFIGHALNIAIFYILSQCLNITVITIPILLAVLPVMFVAAALPVSIGGFGPREASLVALLGMLEVPQENALALSLLYAAVLLTLAAIGGLVQLFFPAQSEPQNQEARS